MLDWRDINVKSCHHTCTHTPSIPKAIPDLSKPINTKELNPVKVLLASQVSARATCEGIRCQYENYNVERGKLEVLMRARSVSALQGLLPADQQSIQSHIRDALFQPFFWNTSESRFTMLARSISVKLMRWNPNKRPKTRHFCGFPMQLNFNKRWFLSSVNKSFRGISQYNYLSSQNTRQFFLYNGISIYK